MKVLEKAAVVGVTGLLVAACGAAESTNDAARSNGVKITSTHGDKEGGQCQSRTDSVALRAGQYVVLGEYDDSDGGWKIQYQNPTSMIFTETAEDATTLVNSQLQDPGFAEADLRKDASTQIHLPVGFSGILAKYTIHKGSAINGSSYREGETGTITMQPSPDGSIDLSVHSIFPDDHCY